MSGVGNDSTVGNQHSNYHWQLSMLQSQGQIITLLQTLTTTLTTGTWLKEIPSGSINGSNTVFTLQYTPVSGSDMVFLSGQLLTGGGVDYTLSGKTITFNIAPSVGENLFVFYQKS